VRIECVHIGETHIFVRSSFAFIPNIRIQIVVRSAILYNKQ